MANPLKHILAYRRVRPNRSRAIKTGFFLAGFVLVVVIILRDMWLPERWSFEKDLRPIAVRMYERKANAIFKGMQSSAAQDSGRYPTSFGEMIDRGHLRPDDVRLPDHRFVLPQRDLSGGPRREFVFLGLVRPDLEPEKQIIAYDPRPTRLYTDGYFVIYWPGRIDLLSQVEFDEYMRTLKGSPLPEPRGRESHGDARK